MARKTLLTESELRQFMKLANLGPIGQNKLNEFGYNPLDEEEEEEMGADLEMAPDPAGLPEPEDEMGDMAPDDAAPEELEMDAEMGAGEGGAGMISIDDFMSALESALEEVTGEPVSTEVDDEMGAEDDMEMGAEDDMEMDVEMGVEPTGDDMGMPPEEEEEELPPMQERSQNDIVNEVARRVAARLGKAQKKEAIADQLAERILKRLTKTK